MTPGDKVILDDGDPELRTRCVVTDIHPGGTVTVRFGDNRRAWLIVPTHRLTPTEDD